MLTYNQKYYIFNEERVSETLAASQSCSNIDGIC